MNGKIVMMIMIAVTILFMMGSTVAVSFTYNQSGDGREPVGPPVTKEPPVDPCNMGFADKGCSPSGTASGPYVQEAWGAAAIACDQSIMCRALQQLEAGINTGLCEGQSTEDYTCVISYTTPNGNNCSGNSSTDCTPGATVIYDPMKTKFTCTVYGSYNITDYKCKSEAS
jgi:hypothetical protein